MSDFTPLQRAKISEAYCLHRGIACTRKFSDEELAWALAYVKAEERENNYANYRIKREQELGWQANYRDEMDMSPDGRRLIDERIWK